MSLLVFVICLHRYVPINCIMGKFNMSMVSLTTSNKFKNTEVKSSLEKKKPLSQPHNIRSACQVYLIPDEHTLSDSEWLA
jgi:hypothetical protein